MVHRSRSVNDSYCYYYLEVIFSASRYLFQVFELKEKIKIKDKDAELKIIIIANI